MVLNVKCFYLVMLVIYLRIVLAMDPFIKDLLTPLPQLGEKCGYESCSPLKDGWINIHIVPHSHAEMGLSKTFQDYYSGDTYGGWMKIRVNWKTILDSTITELWVIKDRRFTISDSELPYFFHWWARRDGTVRRMVYELIRQGRLVFVGGGWGMHDEASTSYQAVIDSYTYSLRKINATFLSCGRPLVGWQADSLGHSREYASLLAQMGFDGLFVNPISFDDELIRMERRALEFVWRGSDDLGPETDIYTHKLFDGYWSPPGFCFGSTCSDPLLVVSDSLFNNVDERIEQFITQIRYRQSPHYNTKQVMVVMGQRHGYFDAKMWFNNIDTLIQKFNERTYKNNEKMHATYSTPACFLKAVYEENPILETKQDDFFPYAYRRNTYTTGMYTTRPTFKYLVRESNIFLQMAKQLQVLINLGNYDEMFENFNWIMGVVQDHNIISGVMRDHVANYYIEKLHSAAQWSTELIQDAFNKIRKTPPNTDYRLCFLNISSCPNTILDRFHVTIYNPLAWPVTMPVRLPIRNIKYEVFDPSGTKIKAVKIVIPDHVFDIPNRKVPFTNELVFIAENIPPLGIKGYFIQNEIKIKAKRAIIKKMSKNQQKNYYIRQTPKENRTYIEQSREYDDFDQSKPATKIGFGGDKFDEINDYDTITPKYQSDIESSIKDLDENQFINVENESPVKNFDQYEMESRNRIPMVKNYDEFDDAGYTESNGVKFGRIQMGDINNESTIQNNDELHNTPSYNESINKTFDENEFAADNNASNINDDRFEKIPDEDNVRNTTNDEIELKTDSEDIKTDINESTIKSYDETEITKTDDASSSKTVDEIQVKFNNELKYRNVHESEIINVDNESNNTTSDEIHKSVSIDDPTSQKIDESEMINVDNESNVKTFDEIQVTENNESFSKNVDGSELANIDNESNMKTFDERQVTVNNNESTSQNGDENEINNVNNETNKNFEEITATENNDVLKRTEENIDSTEKTTRENLNLSVVDDLNKPKFKTWVPEDNSENPKETSADEFNDKDDYYARESKDNFIRNQYIQINLDEYRKITSLNLSNGINTSLDIQYYYYISDVPTDNTTWKPGAYIFRPVDPKPEPIIDFIETRVYKSDIVEEIHTKYSKYASFAVKLYTNNPIIEIDWAIGPIPIEDNFGKEVFIRYTTDLENEGVFYTDANGRQTVKRIRHLRPMYEPYDLDPVAGNFYPVTSRIYIEDPKKNLRFSIFNDRAQGGSSLLEGSIDLMVHRRILTDTSASFIIINETESGKGLIVRGNHYMYLTKADYKQNRIFEKKFAKEIELKPQIMFNRMRQDLPKDIWLNYNNEFTSLNKRLPIGVHILTLQEWNAKTVLLRLENYLEKIDTVKSGIKKVNIKDLFVNIKVLSLVEMNLSANMLLKDNVKLNWRINGSFVNSFNDFYGSDGKIEYSNDEMKVLEDVDLEKGIFLVPQQIRTFVVKYEYIKN